MDDALHDQGQGLGDTAARDVPVVQGSRAAKAVSLLSLGGTDLVVRKFPRNLVGLQNLYRDYAMKMVFNKCLPQLSHPNLMELYCNVDYSCNYIQPFICVHNLNNFV